MARKDSEKPKEIIQSYLVTSARYDFNVYEKRGDRTITMPISKFLTVENDKNHYRIKKALYRLRNTTNEVNNEGIWAVYGIIEKPEILKNCESVRFELSKHLYRDLLDFAKGYTQYELQVAFNFRSQYTMRFYELVSRSNRPFLTYSIDKLREMFLLEDCYQDTNRFIAKVILPAQKELKESKSAYWFDYEKIKEGRAFKYIRFQIHYRPQHDIKIPQQTSIRWDVNKEFLTLLNNSLDTGDKNWKPHRELLRKAQNIDYNEIKKIIRKAREANNPVGYAVNSFRKQTNS